MDTSPRKDQILLLDDDEDDYILLKQALQIAFGERVQLDWYQRTALAAEMVCTIGYEVGLVDYRFANENGIDAIRRIKDLCPDQTVFLFTNWAQEEITAQALSAGATGVIHKSSYSPSSLKTLLGPYLRFG